MNTRHRITAALATVAASAAIAPNALAVTGGREAGPNDFPFVAQVINTTVGGSCTGALVSPNYVLTAVHCAVPTSVGDQAVRVGNTTLNSGGEFRRVTRIITHPSYAGGANDVALLELAQPITNIKPVPIATPAMAYLYNGAGDMGGYDAGVSVGWGYTAPGSGLPNRLQWRSVAITGTTADSVPGLKRINVQAGPCEGDSGGPLLVTYGGAYYVAGVTKAATCGSSGWYSEVGAGTNRDFVTGNMAKMPLTFFGAADWDRDGHKDIIARQEATGDILLFPGISARGYSNQGTVKIGNRWQGYTPFGVADWDNDGKQDIVARQDATGNLMLFPGAGVRGYGAGVFQIGSGYQNYSSFGIADINRDGNQDVVARNDQTGTLYVHYGQGTRTFSTLGSAMIGSGFNAYTAFGVADYDRDGYADIVARNNDAGTNVFLYPGNVSGTFTTARVQIGNGFLGYTPFGLTDWDRDGKVDIIARRDSTQDLFFFNGSGGRGYGDGTTVKIGNGW